MKECKYCRIPIQQEEGLLFSCAGCSQDNTTKRERIQALVTSTLQNGAEGVRFDRPYLILEGE